MLSCISKVVKLKKKKENKKGGQIVGMIMLNVFNHTPTYVLYRGSVCPIASTIFTVCKA